MNRNENRSRTVKYSLLTLFSLGILGMASPQVMAQQQLTTVINSASIPSECRMTVPSGLHFGKIDPFATTDVFSYGVIGFSCTRGTPTPSIIISEGQNYAAGTCNAETLHFRRVKHASQNSYMNYTIFASDNSGFGTGSTAVFSTACTGLSSWALMNLTLKFGRHNPSTSNPGALHQIHLHGHLNTRRPEVKAAPAGDYTDYLNITMVY